MEKSSPERKARKVIDECADCDVCRFLMDSDCLMFPELYRLYDREMETGEKITSSGSGPWKTSNGFAGYAGLFPN
jgi:hypothetical protein